MSLCQRISALERIMAGQNELTEIVIDGGLPDTVPFATFLPSHEQITAAPREWPSTFRRRALVVAKERHAEFVIIGGLPAQ